jgi:preprotein translocase subunit SecA
MLLQRASEIWTRTFQPARQPSRAWRSLARQIDAAASRLESSSAADLAAQAESLRYRSRCGEPLSSLIPDAYPLAIEAARRQLGLRPYFVQILGGIALQAGFVAEMKTGEGKTLAATLPLFLNALRGEPCHLATANDYLAQRDAVTMRPLFESLGLTVGFVASGLSQDERRVAYDCDITYGTAREFGFDFLRDQIALASTGGTATSQPSVFSFLSDRSAASGTVQRRPFGFALIDEADSLLIDEARTPLIISSQAGQAERDEALFRWASQVASRFEIGTHLDRYEDRAAFELTPAGVRLVRSVGKPRELDALPLSEISDAILRAAYVAATLCRDVDYIVEDETKVLIVDEFTGRVARGRKWRNGIHQSVEAREGLPITPLTVHTARIAVPELFGLYDRVSGMTGTASSVAHEFWQLYRLRVCRIPTHRPSQRIALAPQSFQSVDERWAAVVEDVAAKRADGRPVLIGTRTITQSQQLSELLTERDIPHEVLNALNHEEEASIISDAGLPQRVTVATNMAGRGTDICLQGDAESNGGLHVICVEPQSAARIDRQLAGRCGRQGDPGSFQQFLSPEDEVLKEAGVDQKTTEAESSSLSQLIRRAQAAVERRHTEQRSILMQSSMRQRQQLESLGLDPWLDAL